MLISSDSEKFQSRFSPVHCLKILDQLWFNSEERWNLQISELEINAKSALTFYETELNNPEFLWNSAETPNFQSKKISFKSELFQRWFSLRQRCTPLKYGSSNSPSHRFFCYFSTGKISYYVFWIIRSFCFSAKLNLIHFSQISAGKLKSYGFWDLKSHSFSAKKVDLIVFSQISARKLRYYAFWKISYHSFFVNFCR